MPYSVCSEQTLSETLNNFSILLFLRAIYGNQRFGETCCICFLRWKEKQCIPQNIYVYVSTTQCHKLKTTLQFFTSVLSLNLSTIYLPSVVVKALRY
jgi:hypothetical protein